MKKIETYKQLQEEKRLSKLKIARLEMEIRQDVEDIKESLKPIRLVGEAARGLFTSERKNNVVGESIDLTVDSLIRNLLLRRAPFMIRLAASFFLKNYTKNLVAKKGDTIVDWIASKFKNLKRNHREPNTADIEWDT